MARYLITGAAGFIGSHLADRLAAVGHEVVGLDNLATGDAGNLAGSGARLIRGDVADRAALGAAMQGCDGVFHLAAVSSVQAYLDDWAGATRTNLIGAVNVFEAAARAGLPVVYASSAAVYGDPVACPLTEASETRPKSGYGVDKLGCDLHAAAMAESAGLRAVGLRFFNVFGPRQVRGSPYSGVITIFLERWMAGETLTVFGDGSQTRDFIYVADVAAALAAAMEHAAAGGAGVFNICSGRSISIMDLVAALSAAVETPLTVAHAPKKPGDIHISVGSAEAAAAAFGWRAATGLEDGLRETVAWISDHALEVTQ